MKRKFYLFCLAPLALFSCGQQPHDDLQPETPVSRAETARNDRPVKEAVELFTDPKFDLGFRVSPLTPEEANQGIGYDVTLNFDIPGVEGYWALAQWASKYDIALEAGDPIRGADGSITYRNAGKSITRTPEGYLTLDITTSTEYDHPRVDGEPWPHLLIQQDFAGQPNLGRARNLFFNLSFQLNHCERIMSDEEYNFWIHTAHNPYHFYIRNLNPASADYMASLWVGIGSYDYRNTTLSDDYTIFFDMGTQTYIYAFPETAIWPAGTNFHDMQLHSTREGLDLKPLFEDLLTNMRLNGHFLETTLDDLYILGMNYGWEVPGTFDCGFTLYELSLKCVEYAD